ncbi:MULTISPECIES: hypothetical protein [unclassified Myxococcus]|jgi:hypothetical protein|uniref:hypothetical protein n=1 Tax=Myxococcus TaxID=32 RepID=UPI001CBF4F19|nr:MULTISPECIES: hypothetical protein [unclassified Myxococcus]MBZ4401113.1 hypothetical protein [Myxococcus sp. AS-1-15]MBZ4410919.1 hypothetical protein [Myxococcus sp. XM-1-1-1]
MQRIPTQRWAYAVLLLWAALLSAGCGASKFRVAKGQSTKDGKLLLTCEGEPRRISIRDKGYVVPVGALSLECTKSTGQCTANADGTLEVSAGTWVAVKAGRALVASHAEGALCLKSSGATSCESDDEYVLDVAIDCSDSPVDLLYREDSMVEWLPMRGSVFVASHERGLRLRALREVNFSYRQDGELVEELLKAGQEKEFVPGGKLPEELIMRAVANSMRVILFEKRVSDRRNP